MNALSLNCRPCIVFRLKRYGTICFRRISFISLPKGAYQMYQRTNAYQVRKPYTKQRQFKETHIKKEHVFYTGVSISRQRGGLAIKGKPEFRGRNIELVKKVNGRVVFTSASSFNPNGYGAQTVAKFERLKPGLYEIGYFVGGQSYIKVSIAPGCVAQMYWS